MPDKEKIQTVAERFQEKGMGLVVMAGLVEDMDLKYRCFSTVSKSDIYCVLEGIAANVSLMPHDLASIMNGDFVVSPPVPELCEMVAWGADYLDREEPLIIAAVSESTFAAFAVGDVPMVVYMAVRMLTTLKQGGELTLNPFTPSMN